MLAPRPRVSVIRRQRLVTRVVMLTALLVGALLSERALAQQPGGRVTVQQPAVQVFRIDTAVSVPDRGRLLLGGVASGRGGDVTYGPLPYGTSIGRETGTSTIDVGVWIHDLQAIDEWLLSQPVARPTPVRLSSPEAQRARAQLLKRHQSGAGRFSAIRRPAVDARWELDRGR